MIRVKDGMGYTTNKLLNMRVHGKRRMMRPKTRWLDNIQDDMNNYNMTDEMALNRSVRHMKTNAGPLQDGGSLEVRR